jgi:hypothetical protein
MATVTDPTVTPDTAPRDESPAATCGYCGRPFASQQAHDLHLGEAHADALSDDERHTYEAAREEEDADLWYFHMKVVIAIGIAHSLLILGYMVVLSA